MSEEPLTLDLLRRGESERTAFVGAYEPGRVAPHVCALLNGEGGSMLVGVARGGKVLATADDTLAAQTREYLHQNIAPIALFTVSVDPTPDGSILVVDVPAGSQRPYVFEGTVFVRQGRQTVKADAETMRRLVERRASQPLRWERRASLGLERIHLDGDLIAQTIHRAQERRGYAFPDAANHEAVLEQLALSHRGQLTNAADVLFGRDVARRHAQTRVRAVRYETDKGDHFLDEQLFEGPAFSILENGLAFFRRHVAIGAEFPEGSLARESRPQYPFASLREGLVNALVHRDYASFSGSVAISIYPNRIELWNSGRLPKGISARDLQRESHASILVNPDISHVFYLHELMERVGRGTFKIVQECRSLGMRLPEWKEVTGGVQLTFFSRSAGLDLNSRQKDLLHDLAPGTAIRIRDFIDRYASEVSDRQARRDLSDLEAAGLLRREGSGPKTVYYRTDKSP